MSPRPPLPRKVGGHDPLPPSSYGSAEVERLGPLYAMLSARFVRGS